MFGLVMNLKDVFDLVGRMVYISLRVKKYCNWVLKLVERMKKEFNFDVVYLGFKDYFDY